MADTKYAKFFISTVIKLLVFLALCAGVYICANFLESPAREILPSALSALFTYIFLAVIEGGKRSFFSKGYMLENIVPGAIYGIVIYVLSFFVLFVLGETHITGIASGFDLTQMFLQTVKYWLFAGIAIYGYFFHIVQKDFGSVVSVILSALLFAVFAVSQTIGLTVYFDGIASDEAITAAGYLLIGIISGLLIVHCGDMRSASSFLFFYGLFTAAVEGIGEAAPLLELSLRGSHLEIGISIISVIVMVAAIINILLAIKKDNE